jgi:hypothetical protein
MKVLLIVAALVALALPAAAQTNMRVIGVGKVAFDVATPTLAEAQAQVYKAYMPATVTTGITVTAACTTATGSTAAGEFTCMFTLMALPLTAAAQSLALTASVVAADGAVETMKVTAPFTLSLVGPPVAPRAAMSIRP